MCGGGGGRVDCYLQGLSLVCSDSIFAEATALSEKKVRPYFSSCGGLWPLEEKYILSSMYCFLRGFVINKKADINFSSVLDYNLFGIFGMPYCSEEFCN